MRRVALLLVFTATAFAQIVVSERRVGSALRAFQDSAPAQTLHCSVMPIHPQLNYGFRFQAGYVVTVPMKQFQGSGHRWRMITRITPEADHRPVYLMSAYALPPVPTTKVEVEVGGGYLLGEGVYRVRHVLVDDAGRTCRKDWTVDVHLGRGESKVRVAMAPGTVLDFSLRGSRVPPASVQDDARPMRLTILLHAAPSFPRRTRLRPSDILMLLSSVSSVLERVPTTNVRLVAFNLDQQRELYRKDGFRLTDLPAVADAMTHMELGLVDAKVLQNRRGHVETLAGLVNTELTDGTPSDAVVFLGPLSRFADKVPAETMERPADRPQFFFFQLAPTLHGGRRGNVPLIAPDSTLPDSIRHAVTRLGGKTMTIRSPGELAKAIDRLEQTTPTKHTSNQAAPGLASVDRR
jgi:hypothetical protein